MQIRLAILVEGPVSKLAKIQAKKLSALSDSYFWVDGKKLAHHITLFDVLPTPKSMAAAVDCLKNILARQKSFDLSFNGLWKSPSNRGYIGLRTGKPKSLLKLRSQMFQGMEKYNPQEVSTKYSPHITLARYKDFDFPKQIKNNLQLKNKFIAKIIIMARVDKHGQVFKILKRFKLK